MEAGALDGLMSVSEAWQSPPNGPTIGQMDTQPTNDLATVRSARTADMPWAQLTTADRIRHLELEGFVVLPDLLARPRSSRSARSSTN